MVFTKLSFFGIVKNNFGAILIEKYCLGPETSFFFSSKVCVIGSKEELFMTSSHEWML
jgi:hypothetical protein